MRSDHLLVSAELRRRFRNDLDLPPLALGVARVHAKQASREERRLVAAGSGPDFEKDVALVVRVLRQQHLLQLGGERRHSRGRVSVLLVGKRLHFRIARHLVRCGDVALGMLVLAKARDDGLDLRALAGERAVAVEVAHGVRRGQHGVELGNAMRERFELGA